MSVQVPIRLRVEQDGTLKGYVEALNFSGATVSVSGPRAEVAVSAGGGGGDALTLQGHPASFFAAEADLLALEAQVAADEAAASNRALMWERLGVIVQTTAPATGITYAQWLAGMNGHWGWIELP